MTTPVNTGLARRFGAIIYDGLLVTALLFMATVPFVGVRGGDSVSPGDLGYQISMLIVACFFYVGFWAGFGRTLGLQSWRLRIETDAGHKPDYFQASVRFFAAILSWVPLGLGFWWQIWDREQLTWHDRLSGTRLRYYAKEKPAKEK